MKDLYRKNNPGKISFSESDIDIFPFMSESKKTEVKIAIKTLEENKGLLDDYTGDMFKPLLVGKVHSELKSKWGINLKPNFDWAYFITQNNMLHKSKHPERGYSRVDKVEAMKIVGEQVCLDCIVSNPAYDPNIRQIIKNNSK